MASVTQTHHHHVTHHGTITLQNWQESETRAKWAEDMFKTQMGRDMLSVLRNECPSPIPHTIDQAAIYGAMASGYRQCLQVMLSLAAYQTKPVDLPLPTYETPAGPQIENQVEEQEGWEADNNL